MYCVFKTRIAISKNLLRGSRERRMNEENKSFTPPILHKVEQALLILRLEDEIYVRWFTRLRPKSTLKSVQEGSSPHLRFHLIPVSSLHFNVYSHHSRETVLAQSPAMTSCRFIQWTCFSLTLKWILTAAFGYTNYQVFLLPLILFVSFTWLIFLHKVSKMLIWERGCLGVPG